MKRMFLVIGLALGLAALAAFAAERKHKPLFPTASLRAVPSQVASGWFLSATNALSMGDGTSGGYNTNLSSTAPVLIGPFSAAGQFAKLYFTARGWLNTNANPYATNLFRDYGTNSVADTIYVTNGLPHSCGLGTMVQLTVTAGTNPPAPLGKLTNYFLVPVSESTNVFALATSYANALASNIIDLTADWSATNLINVATNSLTTTLTATNLICLQQSFNGTNWFTYTNFTLELAGSSFPPDPTNLTQVSGILEAPPYLRVHSVTNRWQNQATNGNAPAWLWLELNYLQP